MKKIMFISMLLLLFAGCISLVQNGEETISISYLKDGSVRFDHQIKGEKGSLYLDWEGDCTPKVKQMIDTNISFIQKETNNIKNSGNLTQEEKDILIEENNRKINNMLSMKTSVSCNLSDDNSIGVLEYGFKLTSGFENIQLFNNNYRFELEKTEETIESKIRVVSTANNKTGNLLGKIKIYSESKIISIEPADKVELKGNYYEVDMQGMDGKDITVKIERKTKAQINGNGDEDEEEPDIFSAFIQGFTLEKIFSLEKDNPVQWIPTLIIVLILILVIAKIISSIPKKEEDEEEDKKDTKKLDKKTLENKVLATKDKILTGAVNKKHQITMKKKPIQGKPKKEEFNSEEKKQIKTIILSLKESFQNYSKQEIKKAVLGKGYSNKIADEVADFFYP